MSVHSKVILDKTVVCVCVGGGGGGGGGGLRVCAFVHVHMCECAWMHILLHISFFMEGLFIVMASSQFVLVYCFCIFVIETEPLLK